MRIVVNIFVALLGGMALLFAFSMRLSMPSEPGADQQPQKELEALPAPVQHMHDDSHALVSQRPFPLNTAAPCVVSNVALYCTGTWKGSFRLRPLCQDALIQSALLAQISSGMRLSVQALTPAHRADILGWTISGMAASALEAVRAIPLPAAEHLQAPAAAVHAAAGAIKEHAGVASSHLLVHGPYVAILAAEALVLYCLTRLALSFVRLSSLQPMCDRRVVVNMCGRPEGYAEVGCRQHCGPVSTCVTDK